MSSNKLQKVGEAAVDFLQKAGVLTNPLSADQCQALGQSVMNELVMANALQSGPERDAMYAFDDLDIKRLNADRESAGDEDDKIDPVDATDDAIIEELNRGR